MDSTAFMTPNYREAGAPLPQKACDATQQLGSKRAPKIGPCGTRVLQAQGSDHE
jgi:hypothetical protein